MTIYDICYNFLTIIVDNFEDIYQDREKEQKKIMELLTKKAFFSESFKNDIASKGITEDILRKVMMLIIASKAYLYDNYACEKNIQSEIVIDMLHGMVNTLEAMDYNDVLRLFVSEDDMAFFLLDDFYSYRDLIYVGKNQCNEFVYNNKNKLSSLLKINPFEIFKISYFVDNKDFLQSEIAIQYFYDISDEVYSILNSEEDEDDIEIIDEEEPDFYEKFLEIINSQHTEVFVNNFLLYICSNVFEFLSTNSKYLKDKKAHTLLEYLKETSKEEILNDLKSDYEFGSIIMKYFYDNNQLISREELIKRRNKYKHSTNDLVIIKSLNPYYESEEKEFARKKINHFD